MIKDILYNGVKGAFTRLVRLIVYIIIVLVITYVIGLISSKKASALVYKQQFYAAFSNPSQGATFTTSGSQTLSFNESQSWTYNEDYDLVAVAFDQMTYRVVPNGSNYFDDGDAYCDSVTPSGACTHYDITISNNYQYKYNADGDYLNFSLYLQEKVNNSTVQVPCYLSGEVLDTFMCPVQKGHTYQGVKLYIFTTVPQNYTLQTWYNISSTRRYFNYDSTDIVNNQGIITNNQTTIIQQQQQQNQWAQSNTVTGAESSAQSGISTLQSTLNSKMSSVNGLTQVVLAPITMFTNLASNTCTPIQLTAPFVNTTFQLPCMSGIYNQHFGILITLFATVIGGITGYWLCINIAKLIKELVDCDNDRIEVIDL